MTIFEVVVLAIVEGITEFLPVSSTGHMIIASSLMGIQSDEFVKLFTVAIQLGTILSVVVLYFKRFFQTIHLYIKLFVAFLPAVVFGLLFAKKIDALLESPLAVALALVIGGIVLLFVDKWFNKPDVRDTNELSYSSALKIGLMQCIAMIPGVSRSAATIVGGMANKLDRKTAAEFSFFLALPTMLGATLKKLYDFYKDGMRLDAPEIKLLALGNLIGFVVALIAIKYFIDYLSKHGFKLFGWYRIIVGGLLLALLLSGHDLQIL